MYNELDRRLYTVAAEAQWKSVTDVTEEHTGARIGADHALAAFRGSRYVIDSSRRFLDLRESLNDLKFRELDKILLNAAESPGTIPDVVQARIESEARLTAAMDGFTFCLEWRGEQCLKPITANEIDDILLKSRNLAERRKVWEASKQIGPPLKAGLAEVRDLGTDSTEPATVVLHLQVADYGMSVRTDALMDKVVWRPSRCTGVGSLRAGKLAERWAARPERPGALAADRWGQEWPGAGTIDLTECFAGKSRSGLSGKPNDSTPARFSSPSAGFWKSRPLPASARASA
jgi:peptidyl-dipeptidase A